MKITKIIPLNLLLWPFILNAWEFKIYNWTDETLNVRIHRTAELTLHEDDVGPIDETDKPFTYKSGGYCLSGVTVSGNYESSTIDNPYNWMNKCYNYEIHIWGKIKIPTENNESFIYSSGADPKKICPVGQPLTSSPKPQNVKTPIGLGYVAEFR